MLFLPSVSARYLQESFDGLLVDVHERRLALINSILRVDIPITDVKINSITTNEKTLVIQLERFRNQPEEPARLSRVELLELVIERDARIESVTKTLAEVGISMQQPSQNFFSISEEVPDIEIVDSKQSPNEKPLREFTYSSPLKESMASEQKTDSSGNTSKLSPMSLMSGLWNILRTRKSFLESSSLLQSSRSPGQFSIASRMSTPNSQDSIIHRVSKKFAIPTNSRWNREHTPIKHRDSQTVKSQIINFNGNLPEFNLKSEDQIVYYIKSAGYNSFDLVTNIKIVSYNLSTQETEIDFTTSPSLANPFKAQPLEDDKRVPISDSLLEYFEKEFIKNAEYIIEKNYSKITCINLHRHFLSKSNGNEVAMGSFRTIEQLRRLVNLAYGIRMDLNFRLLINKLIHRSFESIINNLEQLILCFFSYRNKEFKLNSYTTFLLKLFIHEITLVYDEYQLLFTALHDSNAKQLAESKTELSSPIDICLREQFIELNRQHLPILPSNFNSISLANLITHTRESKFHALIALRSEFEVELEDL
jgi:hypothetical protein